MEKQKKQIGRKKKKGLHSAADKLCRVELDSLLCNCTVLWTDQGNEFKKTNHEIKLARIYV